MRGTTYTQNYIIIVNFEALIAFFINEKIINFVSNTQIYCVDKKIGFVLLKCTFAQNLSNVDDTIIVYTCIDLDLFEL